MNERCRVAPVHKSISADELNDSRLVAMRVQGMGCVNCAARVHNALLTLDGVISADVDWERGLALVDYLPTKTDIDALARAVMGAGDDGRHSYRAHVISFEEKL